MNFESVRKIADAVLYEGYALYPYRANAVKNRQRFNFGGVYPPAYSQAQQGADACTLRTECLALAGPQTVIEIRVRCLQLVAREMERLELRAEGPVWQPAESIEIDGCAYASWQEAIEREVTAAAFSLQELGEAPRRCEFAFDAAREIEPIADRDGRHVANVCRRRERVCGAADVSTQKLGEAAYRIRVVIANETPLSDASSISRDEALLRSCLSTHAILGIEDGEFVSLLEPPDEYGDLASGCRNLGLWPVLVGDAGQRKMILSSPIILYDYPAIAPESAGDLFDGAEIDELLTLRIQSLTDDEKRQMRSLDARTREILERTETLPQEQLQRLHGAIRGLRPLREATP